MPQFVPERKELWITDQDRGLFGLRFTNGSWISTVTSSAETQPGELTRPQRARTAAGSGSSSTRERESRQDRYAIPARTRP